MNSFGKVIAWSFSLLLLSGIAACAQPVPLTSTPSTKLTAFAGLGNLGRLAVKIDYESRCTANQPVYGLERRFWYKAPNLYRLEEYSAGGELVSIGVSNGKDKWYYQTETKTAAWSKPVEKEIVLSILQEWELAALRTNTLDGYTSKALGEAVWLGRKVEQFELTYTGMRRGPFGRCDDTNPAVQVRVDEETKLQLNLVDRNGAGQLLRQESITEFDVNPTFSPSIFEFTAPPDTTFDLHVKDVAEFVSQIPENWRRVAKQAEFKFFVPRQLPEGFVAPGAPELEGTPPENLVMKYVSPGSGREFLLTESLVAPTMPDETGEQVHIHSAVGQYIERGNNRALYFRRSGTYIALTTESEMSKEELLKIASTFVPVPKN